MLEEKYPQEAWIRVYTDGSATNAVLRGGAGVYIQYPCGREQKEALPTGLHCTNYRAEMEALIHAAHTISCEAQEDEQVVFLTDALSVLQAANSNQLPRLKKALSNIKCLRTTLQWIPAHCGIDGNEEADNLAKTGAKKEQKDNKVCPSETNTILKSLYRTPPSKTRDSYHQLSRAEQVVIFRLRTGHCRLKQHLHRKLHLSPSPTCSCGEAEETVEHVLQDCQLLRTLRDEMWPQPTSVQGKLYGSVGQLRQTALYISRADLQV